MLAVDDEQFQMEIVVVAKRPHPPDDLRKYLPRAGRSFNVTATFAIKPWMTVRSGASVSQTG